MATNDAQVRTVPADELMRTLAEDDTQVFLYVKNSAGASYTATLVAVLLVVAGGMFWTGASGDLMAALFSLAVTGALFISGFMVYWWWFARTHFLALSRNELIVGHARRAYGISMSALNPRSLGFLDVESGVQSGTLTLSLPRGSLRVHLFNPLTHVDRLELFLAEVLRMMHNEPGESSPN